MLAVPRAAFVDADLAAHADEDGPLPIGEGQTISQPLVVALMAQALELDPGDRALEVGAGSGYAAAVLSRLVARVDAVEVREALARRAAANLAAAGVANVAVHHADGTRRLAGGRPLRRHLGRRGRPARARGAARAAGAGRPPGDAGRAAAGAPAPGAGCGAGRRARSGVEDLGIPVRFVPLVSEDERRRVT